MNNSRDSSMPAMSRSASPRPQVERQRSNSLPLVDALGCSAEEARIILAEGRAAVLSRHPPTRREGQAKRRPLSLYQHEHVNNNDTITTFRPQDHIHYLAPHYASSTVSTHSEEFDEVEEDDDVAAANVRGSFHTRMPSNQTDTSTSTITGPKSPDLPSLSPPFPPGPGSPLGSYSSNLAKFIQTQLNSIPSYKPSQSVSSGSFHSVSSGSSQSVSSSSSSIQTIRPRSSARSPSMSKKPIDDPPILEMPPIRPPLRSAFSAWSSTDDETDTEEDLPPLPTLDGPRKDSITGQYTPSILHYYEQSPSKSYLLSSSPNEEVEHPFRQDFRFPAVPQTPPDTIPRSLPASSHKPASRSDDVPSVSHAPDMTSSSGRSTSSDSSYFETRGRGPSKQRSALRDKIVAAVTPTERLTPFEEGGSHSMQKIFPSPNRVMVNGMSFDLIRA
ncbi:hypothetical protein GQ43DRAFT_480784 [Delitschia confertaspora ATCC 74209]|uniref:Uncharacterized protein n=1 Tax=Delitschia confertaspora ATCC 74209 TaxID=1513339 RepID=A0A9P4JQC5_9PLEO|nr:hypothetical protein GQ43DRAFT_480784 [Delitschia confertaspora ATCC 74209]